jgi:hypothetical protein
MQIRNTTMNYSDAGMTYGFVTENANFVVVEVSGELYKFSDKSPAKHLRTPGKGERRPLADTANILVGGRRDEKEEAMVVKEARPREASRGRKAREEMKKQLNLSYFQVSAYRYLVRYR